MQYAAFHLGNEVLCISKPKDVLAVKGQQQIYEMRLVKVYSHRCISCRKAGHPLMATFLSRLEQGQLADTSMQHYICSCWQLCVGVAFAAMQQQTGWAMSFLSSLCMQVLALLCVMSAESGVHACSSCMLMTAMAMLSHS